MLMKTLEELARERGYSIQRKGRFIKWIRNDNNKLFGLSDCVADAYNDIKLDYESRLKNNKEKSS